MKKLLFVFMLSLLMVSMAWGQTYLLQEGFTTASFPADWSGSVYFNTTANSGNLPGSYGAGFNANDKYLQLPALGNVGTLSFWMKGSSATSQISIKVQKSVDGGGFVDVATFPKPHTNVSTQFSAVINDPSSNVVLKLIAYEKTLNSLYVDDIEVTEISGTPSVATPTFDPVESSFENDLDVSILCSEATATIYYTLDGTDPTDSSTPYTAPINLTQTTTIKAIAYATGFDPSSIASATYTKLEPASTTLPYTEAFTSDINGVYTRVVTGDKPWYYYDGTAACNGYNGTGNEEHWMVLPGINFDSYSSERMNFTTIANYGSIDEVNYLKLFWSNDYYGIGDPSTATWNEIPFANGGVGGGETSSGILDLSTITGTNVYLAFKYVATTNPTRWQIDNINVFQAVPIVTVDADLQNFSYSYSDGPSAEQSFTVSGVDLEGNITITAPSNYEISVGTGASFVATSPITITPIDGIVASTPIYVRLKSGLEIGDYNAELISIASTGVVTQDITCNGTVIDPDLRIEGFNNYPETSTSYNDGTFLGADGSTWDYFQCAGQQSIDGKSITLGKGRTPTAEVSSGTISGGIGNLSFDYMQAFSTNVNLDVYVNDVFVGNVTSSSQVGVVLNSGTITVNQPGNFVITFYNQSGGQVVIDNISWYPHSEIPEDTPTTVNGMLLLIEGSSANVDDDGVIPPFNNGAFIATESIVLELSGMGPWTVTITTDAAWGAYYMGGAWHAVPNSGGQIILNLGGFGKSIQVPIVLGDEDPTLPVELSSFTVILNAQNAAVLNWITQSETEVSGFHVYRNAKEELATAQLISNLIPATNGSTEHSYSYIDAELFDQGTYYYWLQISDLDGSIAYHGPITLIYGAGDDPEIPGVPKFTELKSIFPNPFNPSTNVSYSLAEAANVRVKVFNSRGQLVRSYEPGMQEMGNYRLVWDGTDEKGQTQATGIYFFQLQAGNKTFSSKAVLMK